MDLLCIGPVEDWQEKVLEALLIQNKSIRLFIDSNGGSIFSAMSIVNLVGTGKGKVETIVIGECSSAAIAIFAVSRCRFVFKNSRFLFHSQKGETPSMSPRETLTWAKEGIGLEEWYNDLIVDRLGKIGAKWIKESYTITGKEMVDRKLAKYYE